MNKPAKCISVDAARELRDQWLDTRGSYYRLANGGNEDCSDVFYTLAELEEYIEYVKTQSKDQGIDKPGIRIYFGAYADGGKRATVFLAPTVSEMSDSDNNYKIDPFNLNQGGWPPNNY